jgi:small subunit ribosomal protein S24e
MEILVEKEKDNPLLKRKEVYFRLKYEEEGVTPSRQAVRQKLSGLFAVDADRIVIEWIKPEFGKSEAYCYARIYETPEDLRAVEEDYIIKRNFESTESAESEGQESEGGA